MLIEPPGYCAGGLPQVSRVAGIKPSSNCPSDLGNYIRPRVGSHFRPHVILDFSLGNHFLVVREGISLRCGHRSWSTRVPFLRPLFCLAARRPCQDARHLHFTCMRKPLEETPKAHHTSILDLDSSWQRRLL